ncbi:MAG: RNA polymerase sigma factor, partial [Clostridia bacterium]|nr:RNA polymerase sigma factor [Clostridia bacterium]
MNENTARRDNGGAKPIYEMLSNEFAENYIEKLFYFCLKKTGSADEAEELSADITLQVMSALAKGTVPQSFSAWVWQIARNRCARWAKARSVQRAAFAPDDVSGYELPDERDDSNVESALIQDEQIKLLRRELAFISREYRDIVVAHYIENRRLSQIARALSLPEGTVKTRLARARNILKEGMNMAREFGQRSYKPEELNFSSSGSQPSGLPWKAVERLIPVNILCEANNNPCTVEELSVELGVAMPYMEEDVRILEEGELL